MTLFGLMLAYWRAKPLAVALTLASFALGIGTIALLLIGAASLERAATREAKGIDLVVGAKGSPIQLVLSSVFHVDVPTGNIPLEEAERLSRHPMVRKAIPLALGDSVDGHRIVGTTEAYPVHYGARLAEGRYWREPMEAVLGAQVARHDNAKVGEKFVGAHGVVGSGPAHADHPYSVVGILAPTGTVIDRLVLTGVESVWAVHAEHQTQAATPGPREITALLIAYRSPLAAATLPREINTRSALQAASPAYEMARLFAVFGVALDVLRAFAGALILGAGLGVFATLSAALEARRLDLAVLRALGATRGRVFGLVALEGFACALIGALVGLALAHLAAEIVGRTVAEGLIGGATWVEGELWLIALALGVGAGAALVPALRAYRADVAATLAQRRG
jgi:putative ABC transport system permease protein